MSKKLIALIILLVAVIGVYGTYYVYATTVLIPGDLIGFKNDYNSIQNPPIDQETIDEINSSTAEFQSGSVSLSDIPQSQRQQIANNLTSSMQPLQSQLESINQSFQNNNGIATRYDLIFKGNVANEIRQVYSDNATNMLTNMSIIINNMATDMANGNTTAYVNDVQQFVSLGQQFNNLTTTDKPKLHDIITQLSG